MKYKVIFELDENRKTCLDCPFLDGSDYCNLQDIDVNYEYNDSWDTMLSRCPLIPETREIKVQSIENHHGGYDRYRCPSCNSIITFDRIMDKYCVECGQGLKWPKDTW